MFKKSKAGILQQALAKLRLISDNCRPVRDAAGVIGYRFGRWVLVAKPKLYEGRYVSCHRNRIIMLAIKEGREILFYIRESDVFYMFNPTEIINHPLAWKNRRAGEVMLNFPVTLGNKVSRVDLFQLQLYLEDARSEIY